MKCINCGCELPDDSGFCFQCGAKQPEIQTQEEAEHQFCPYCGAKNDGDAVFCSSCGKAMDMTEKSMATPVKEKSCVSGNRFSKKMAIGAAAVLLGVGAVGIGVAFLGGNHKYIAYLKDNSVSQADLEHYKKEAVEYSGNYGDEDTAYDAYVKVKYSKDGKYVFYPTEVTYEGQIAYPEFRLNMQKVGKEENAIKIDSSVWRYSILEQNKVVYIKSGNNTLYINDKKNNKEKIASNVVDYYIDKDEKHIVWVETEGETYAIYQQDLSLKKEKKALIKNVAFYNVSENLKQIVAMEEDTLYMVKDFGDKEKISSNVSLVISNSEETGSVYYSKKPEKMLEGPDIIEDDCAETDANMTEPVYDDFLIQKVEKNEYTGKYEEVEGLDQEAYDLAWEEYEAKERRDDIREDVNELELGTYVNKLCCFQDGKETLIDGAYGDLLYDHGVRGWTTGIFAFTRYKMEEVPKIKMSEIDAFSDLSDMYYKNLKSVKETCVYTGKKIVVLAEDFEHAVALDPEKKLGYGLKAEGSGEEPETYTLMSFDIGESSDGTCKTVAEGVDSIQMFTKGKIYYLTDVNESAGELYCNEKHVDSDVFVGSLKKVKDEIAYAVDYDSNNCRATLKIYDGKEAQKIADDVHAYCALDEKSLAVLVDYNLNSQEGDLKYSKGKDKLVEIDEDVTAIFGGTVFNY